MSSNEHIEKQVKEQGYSVVNINDVYFYTVGFGLKGKQDLIGFGHYPISLFQIAASLHNESALVPNKVFLIPEIKVPGLGLEPARCKTTSLTITSNSLVLDFLAKADKDFNPLGFLLLMGPDKDNIVANDTGSLIQYDANKLICDFVSGVKFDVDEAIAAAKKVLSNYGG